jgi:hypothetical protein
MRDGGINLMKRNICIFEIKKKAAGFALLLCLFLTFGFLSGCGENKSCGHNLW